MIRKELSETASRRLGGVPPSKRKMYLKVLDGKASPRTAIKMMCSECMGWEGAGKSLAAEIRGCQSTACPLHAYRPFQKKGDGDDQD